MCISLQCIPVCYGSGRNDQLNHSIEQSIQPGALMIEFDLMIDFEIANVLTDKPWFWLLMLPLYLLMSGPTVPGRRDPSSLLLQVPSFILCKGGGVRVRVFTIFFI